jgi:protein SCO1/2
MLRNRFLKSGIAGLLYLFCAISAANASTAVPVILQEVGIDQKLNESIPLGLEFRDESGKTVRLSDYFGKKPVILSLAYYECPMLCTYVLNGLVRSLRPLSFNVGNEFEMITVSFDPTETSQLAAAKKAVYLKEYGRTGAESGWHFLTGDAEPIRQLTKAVGFKYKYDAQDKQFAHASGIMVLTPEGKLARYFYGIEYPSRDLRLALVEASQNKIGSRADQLMLYCFRYDPTTGKYSAYATNFVRLGGILTVIGLSFFVISSLKKEKRKTKEQR